jgi:hypothetical protein
MKPSRTIGALTTAAVLAVPASAFAHGSVFETEARLGAGPEMQTQYAVTNHGFTFVLKETNNATDLGMVNYKVLPRAYRDTLPDKQDWLDQGDTGAQPHATCRGVLGTDAILAWQGTDPFYNYVPWQKESAGLEDDPATWIAVVKAETGVDLATEADPAAACLAEGGTYTPADEIQTTAKALAAGTVEQETAPLTAEIAKLTASLTTVEGARAALQTALDAAKAELAKLATPVKVALPSAKLKPRTFAKQGTSVTLNGVAGSPVSVEVAIGEGAARKLKLKSSVLARGKATFGADGTASIVLKPGKAAGKALAKRKRALAFTVTAQSGDRVASSGGTFAR